MSEQDSIYESIASRMNGFLYRCRNDEHYTMLNLSGRVQELTGYAIDHFITRHASDGMTGFVVKYVVVLLVQVGCTFAFLYLSGKVEVGTCGALCSYYAEYGGLMVGYEDNEAPTV